MGESLVMLSIHAQVTFFLVAGAALARIAIAMWHEYNRTIRTIVLPFAIVLSLAACIGWAISTFAPSRDEYTRCHKCNHILKGLSEPRCPEYGEVI
jgi:hypothetical protein